MDPSSNGRCARLPHPTSVYPAEAERTCKSKGALPVSSHPPSGCAYAAKTASNALGFDSAAIAPALLAGCLADRRLGGGRAQIVAAVLPPRRLVLPQGAGMLLPVAHRGDTGFVETKVGEVLLGRVRAPLAERQVVLAGPTLVAVSLDPDALIGPLLRLVEERLQYLARRREQLGAVVIEVDAGRSDVGRLYRRCWWLRHLRGRRRGDGLLRHQGRSGRDL